MDTFELDLIQAKAIIFQCHGALINAVPAHTRYFHSFLHRLYVNFPFRRAWNEVCETFDLSNLSPSTIEELIDANEDNYLGILSLAGDILFLLVYFSLIISSFKTHLGNPFQSTKFSLQGRDFSSEL
jgi:hypothetical protein